MNIKSIQSAVFTLLGLLCSHSLIAQIPQEGLQGYYKLDGNDYANYSTQNSVPLDPFPTGGFLLPAQNRYGEPDMALKLINQYLDTQSDPQIYDFSAENALSLCLWMKIDETVIDWTGLLNNWAGFDVGGYYLGLTPNQEIRWNVNVDPPIDSSPITTGTWVHVAAVYDGDTAYLYLDGNLAAQRVYGSNLLTSVYPFTVGTQANVPENIFPGVFDDILIYNRSLSAQEVLDIVQALSIEDLDAFERAVRLGPNPTSGRVQMTYDTSFGRLTQLNIYDLKGALMDQKVLSEPENEFDISNYSSGVYTFEFTTADGQKVQKKIIKN